MWLLRRRNPKPDRDVQAFLADVERLRALNESRLASAPSPDLDEMSRAAAEKLNTPIALVSLVDDQRQFFAGATGLTNELAAERSNGLEFSYCKYVVGTDEPFVVENALADPVVSNNRSTIELGYRAYLGVPIRKDGHTLGSFCVIDTEERRWTDEELQVLQKLADEVMSRINRKAAQR